MVRLWEMKSGQTFACEGLDKAEAMVRLWELKSGKSFSGEGLETGADSFTGKGSATASPDQTHGGRILKIDEVK